MSAPEYIKLSDITDELVKPIIVQDDIDHANDRLADLATDLEVDPYSIPNPPPFKVRELAIAFACEHSLEQKTGVNPPGRQSTQDGADAYEYKRRRYTQKIDTLTRTLDAGKLLGRVNNNPAYIMQIFRG